MDDIWNKIKTEVQKNENVLTVTMEKLRNAYGASRLGVNVCDEISSTLARLGLGHVPVVLPTYQQELVRLYQKGTPVGDLIEAVLTPGEQNDLMLSNYAVIVQKVRELVAGVTKHAEPGVAPDPAA